VTRSCLFLALFLVVSLVTAHGHHSFGAFYFEDQSISIEGSMVEFDYRNPHAWVHVLAPDSLGEMRKYGAEWTNPNRLRQQQITKDTLKAGDHLILTGSPGRTASEYRIHLKRIERPADGWKWAGGRGERR
jgi:hypothetical protein